MSARSVESTIHFGCHLVALALLAAAVLVDSPWIAFAGTVLGIAGALAFGTFFAVVAKRMSLPGVKGNRHEAPGT